MFQIMMVDVLMATGFSVDYTGKELYPIIYLP